MTAHRSLAKRLTCSVVQVVIYHLAELAVNDCEYQEDQNGDDGDRNYPVRSHSKNISTPYFRSRARGSHYLRPIVLNVLTLRSTYPSLSRSLDRVFNICSLWTDRSAKVSRPIFSVSLAIRELFLRRSDDLSRRSVPDKSCCLCSVCGSMVGSSVYRSPNRAVLSELNEMSLRLAVSTSV